MSGADASWRGGDADAAPRQATAAPRRMLAFAQTVLAETFFYFYFSSNSKGSLQAEPLLARFMKKARKRPEVEHASYCTFVNAGRTSYNCPADTRRASDDSGNALGKIGGTNHLSSATVQSANFADGSAVSDLRVASSNYFLVMSAQLRLQFAELTAGVAGFSSYFGPGTRAGAVRLRAGLPWPDS